MTIRCLIADDEANLRTYLRSQLAKAWPELEVCAEAENGYFQSSHKYTLVVTKDREYLVKKSIKALQQELDPEQFWQIHRRTLINIACVQRFQRSLTGGGTVTLKKRPEPLEVSRAFSHLFRQM